MKQKNFLYLLAGAVLTINFMLSSITYAESAEAAESPQIILEKADEIRFPRESFQVNVSITTSSPDHSNETWKYQVLSKGNENSIVKIIEPVSERGQIMLMKRRDLWVFMPNISQPIRLSLSQRLTGQVANGDIARANFAGDYNPKLLRIEKIDSKNYYVLELTGVDKSVTYQKVIYWIQQSNYWPYRAEFYSLSNRLLKTSRYENFEMQLGQLRPTRLVMEDALREGEVSILKYSSMKLKNLPDKIFTKNYLKKLN